MTTILDIVGTALIVGAAFVVLGLGAALAAAGLALLVASWSLSGGDRS